jgi:hypothetical protein
MSSFGPVPQDTLATLGASSVPGPQQTSGPRTAGRQKLPACAYLKDQTREHVRVGGRKTTGVRKL